MWTVTVGNFILFSLFVSVCCLYVYKYVRKGRHTYAYVYTYTWMVFVRVWFVLSISWYFVVVEEIVGKVIREEFLLSLTVGPVLKRPGDPGTSK